MENHTKVWRNLWRLSALMRNRCEKLGVCDQENLARLSLAQAKVLDCIFQSTKSNIMLKDIAGALHMTPGAASLLVDSLVKRGMITRRTSESDRRAVTIELSDAGRKFRENFEAILDNLSIEMISGIPEKSIETFIEVQEQIIAALTAKN